MMMIIREDEELVPKVGGEVGRSTADNATANSTTFGTTPPARGAGPVGGWQHR
jgi:hypothetical protein